MDADQLLQGLGLAAGLPQLRFDAQGCACLLVDGRLKLNFEHDADSRSIHVYTALGPLPASGREALYAQLLQANLFGAGTQGATLAVDAADQEVVLCRSVAVDATGADAFATLVDAFVAAAEHWAQRLDGSTPAAAPEPPAVPRFDAFLRA